MPIAPLPNRLDRFYRLLPAIHRLRDGEAGEPLRALFEVIAEQAALIEDDIAQQYDNWFIETCADWVVPYIADLIGHDPIDPALADAGPWAMPRREVANTLRARRRKGTLAQLEQLASDVAGWPASAVEFGRLLGQTQSARLTSPERGRTADLRDGLALAGLGGALDGVARSPDLRRLVSQRATGRDNAASVGVFVWRLKTYSVTHSAANCAEDIRPNAYTFSVLGNDTPLVNRALADDAGPRRLPLPISRRAFALPRVRGGPPATASPDYYGRVPDSREAQSVVVWAPGWPKAGSPQPIPAAQIIVADLAEWTYAPPPGFIAVDPERGRLAFPPRQLCKGHVTVSYHYGFSADLGGGEYTRAMRQEVAAEVVPVHGVDALRRALRPWLRHHDEHGTTVASTRQPAHTVIEITDSGVYTVPLNLWLDDGHSLQIRAAQRTRPVLRLLDWQSDQPDSLTIGGGPGSRFTLDGILLAGRGMIVEGAVASVTVRHSTLVPGWSLDTDCCPRRPAEASIEIRDSDACLSIERSIVGSIVVNNSEVTTDPSRINVTDSIVDATSADGDGPAGEAIGGHGGCHAFAVLRVERSTIIGRVLVHAVELGSNSIFMGRLLVARRQPGCLRFCYVSEGSRTPRRYECQPGLAEAADDDPVAQQQARDRVRPRFDSLRFGSPVYCRLAEGCDQAITHGADDGAEMGVFHHLHAAQRLTNLRTRLDEFAPASADTGVIFAD